jgi:hypothetical protein
MGTIKSEQNSISRSWRERMFCALIRSQHHPQSLETISNSQIALPPLRLRAAVAVALPNWQARAMRQQTSPSRGSPLSDRFEFRTGPSPCSADMGNRACRLRCHSRGDNGLSLVSFRNEQEVGVAGRKVISNFGASPCMHAAMVSTDVQIAMFGGLNSINTAPAPTIFHESWVFDGKHWTHRQDIGPGPRWAHARCLAQKAFPRAPGIISFLRNSARN